MDDMGLTSFPSSVGALTHLTVLSASKNQLHDLPVTLAFCLNLEELNLKDNKFTCLPGILLRLKNLQDLRRYENPLPQLYNGFSQLPHIKISRVEHSQHDKFEPDSLQTLCAKAAFTNYIGYWTCNSVGPLQCKILDCLASKFTLCEHCNRAVFKTGTDT